MAHPASRVLAMLELLQAHRHLTGPDLAGRLGVDERTVRRYAGTLADLGIPVTTVRGRYGGYRLLPGFKLPPLMFTDDEAVAVLLGLVAAERLGLSTEAPAAAAAAAKISRVLPRPLAERLAALRGSLGFTLRDRPPPAPGSAAEHAPPDTGTLLTVGAATRARERLAVTYRSWRGPTTERDVDPYGVVFHAGRWYLVGHDHRSGEVRSLRVDRIAAARPTAARFTPPPDFDPVAHLRGQLAGLPWTWEVEVLVEADLAELRARVPASVGDLAEADGGVRLRCRAQSLPGMAQLLAGLGHPFTVVGPAELRDAVADLAGRLAGYAGRG
ncbi:helix-turn-helix transcriptional regulator [Jidongwangia harbinensis]|uniref:helix-turn-helix transcriptional regulator n=1 Tax=Jidongwangia harbinensis TaxID=2878561 RepID=UPI001CDA0621|nr:YafY family protein [Jidongwangia harbinensis]MCA2214659.1 YafY family transcriptional regulator [Jidongwangia harbinensis]